MRRGERLVFDGWIGLGTTSGNRIVVGHWPISPFGPFTDVMLEDSAGHRVLFAPTDEVGEFVASTYRFDTVEIGPVSAQPGPTSWAVQTPNLWLGFDLGPRGTLGRVLRAVPGALAKRPAWIALIDRPAAE